VVQIGVARTGIGCAQRKANRNGDRSNLQCSRPKS
jgi:hypothetical protein